MHVAALLGWPAVMVVGLAGSPRQAEGQVTAAYQCPHCLRQITSWPCPYCGYGGSSGGGSSSGGSGRSSGNSGSGSSNNAAQIAAQRQRWNTAMSLNSKGCEAMRQRDWEKAVWYFREALKYAPTDPTMNDNLAKANQQIAQRDQRNRNNEAEARRLDGLARAAEQRGDWVAAFDLYAQALKLDYGNQETTSGLDRTRNVALALKDARKAAATGDWSAAADHYADALSFRPNDRQIRDDLRVAEEKDAEKQKMQEAVGRSLNETLARQEAQRKRQARVAEIIEQGTRGIEAQTPVGVAGTGGLSFDSVPGVAAAPGKSASAASQPAGGARRPSSLRPRDRAWWTPQARARGSWT